MTPYKIFVSDKLSGDLQQMVGDAAQVDDRAGIDAEALPDALQGCDALIVRSRTKVTAALLDAVPSLKVVGRAGVGVDNIDLDAAKARGVLVVNAPTATSLAVAELTVGLLFALARHIPRADASMKRGEWAKKSLKGVELYGKTLGILGFGRIGVETGKRAAALGMTLLAYDPYLSPEEIARRGAESLSLEALYRRADFISLHLPLTEETKGLLDAAAFDAMKEGVRIVCAARGGIIDESALLDALERGKVAGAALDVFAQEPPGASALVAHPNVIATPHIGAQTAESQTRVAEHILEEVLRALRGESLRWRVV
jgi:D-3-phosphoglycerate dehydrogenase